MQPIHLSQWEPKGGRPGIDMAGRRQVKCGWDMDRPTQ